MNGRPGAGLVVDHATWAGPELEGLRRAFRAAGLPSVYGGAHANGVTHMDVVGFPDGSYLELIALRDAGKVSPVWDAAIRTGAGPAAWAARAESIAAEANRLRAAGVPVRGPEAWSRRTPEGRTAAWELAFPGEGEPGSLLPFLIEDRTPRAWRVAPTPGVEATGAAGLGQIVLLVPNAGAASAMLRRAYGWPMPSVADAPVFGARLLRFEGTPACVAEPLATGPARALRHRLGVAGPAPAAFLLRLADRAAARALPLGAEEPWPGGTVRWLEADGLGTRRLGVLWSQTGGDDADGA